MAESIVDKVDRELAERDLREREQALKAQREHEEKVKRYMGADEFVVVAPYVTLKVNDRNGGLIVTGFHEGGTFKAEDVDEANLRHHVDTGLVAPTDSPEAELAAPAGTPKPGEPPNVPVEEQPVTSLPLDERQRRQRAALDASKDTESQSRTRRTPAKQADEPKG